MYPPLILVQVEGNLYLVAKYVTDYENADEEHIPVYEKIADATSIGLAMKELDVKNARDRRTGKAGSNH